MAEHVSIAAYRQLMSTVLSDFIASSNEIGGVVSEMANRVRAAFEAQLSFIIAGVRMPRPNDAELMRMLNPLSDVVNGIQEFRQSNRHLQDYFNHLSAISESIVALSWITQVAPVRFVQEMREAGEYFGNRVLSSNRNNRLHVDWVSRWGRVLGALGDYVREHHRTGFSWGVASAGCGGDAPSVAAPPPPPPPPISEASVTGPEGDFDRSALFAQINTAGENITRRYLRPSTISTRQDRQVRGDVAEPVPLGEPQQHRVVPRPVPQREPRLVLEGRKWRVEYQQENYALVVRSTDMSESVHVYQCNNVGVAIENKVNGVSIDNTRRGTIAVNDVISSVELIRCSNITVNLNGGCPMICVDNCDSIQIFVTDRSLGVELVTSNSTSVNFCILHEDGTYEELPVPEQIRTVIVNGRLQSYPVERQ